MMATPTSIPDVLVLKPTVHADHRGFFLESFNAREFTTAVGGEWAFVQDNHSRSQRHVLRGLHYQVGRRSQGKLLRVVSGAVFDVAVDVRRGSATFGQWAGFELSAENHLQAWIPPGCAHGFLVLSDHADLVYKVTDYYDPESERVIRWDDPAIGIEWPLGGADPILSDRDRAAGPLAEADLPEYAA